MTQRRVRVLIAEDSATTREYIRALLETDSVFEVIGTAPDGIDAVAEVARLKPDLILMDVRMPRMNGYEAARAIMESTPLPIVMMSASLDREAQKMTFNAIEAGALTVIAKPHGPHHPERAASAKELIDTIRLMSEVRVVRRWREKPPRATPVPPLRTRGKVRLIAIAASTGGPAVVIRILKCLTPSFGVPIVVVQHIAPGFAQGFSEWIAQETRFMAKVAESGEIVEGGAVYIAPEGQQIHIGADGHTRLSDDPGEDGFKPSATYFFSHVAEEYGPAAIGIVLTGMGRDGAAGLRRLREAGGVTLAQDEESCVVFGMPQEAIRLGAVDRVLSPDGIAAAINGALRGEP